MEMKSSWICNLHSCIEDSPPPNYPVQSKFMGLMFVPEFTVQYQVWCSSRLHFLTLLEPWYMQSRNRFSIVALRKWQKTRLRSRLHTAFDSYWFWFKAGPDRSHTKWSRLSFFWKKKAQQVWFPIGVVLSTLVHRRSKMVESYITGWPNSHFKCIDLVCTNDNIFTSIFHSKRFLETLKISIDRIFFHVFLVPAAVDILCYRQNGPLKNLFSSSKIYSVVFQTLVCFVKVIITSACPNSLSPKSRQIS